MSSHDTFTLALALLGFATTALGVYRVKLQLQLVRLEIQRHQLAKRE